MSTIKIELGDWLKNASIIGLLSVLEKKQTIDNKIMYYKNYIEFDSSMLDEFEEEYFKVLIEKHEKSLSWYKLVSYEPIVENYLNKDLVKGDIEDINNIINEFKSKLKSNSYKNGYLLLNDSEVIEKLESELSKIKISKNQEILEMKDTIIKQCNLLMNAICYLKRSDVKRIIAAKNVMYDIVQPFWTNVSFLLKTNNKNDMYKLYRDDFIKPTLKYIDSVDKKRKYSCFTCDNKVAKFGKPEAFDLTWIVKTGADMSRKSSHFWNLNGDSYICPICNLLYSCLPLGFIILKGKGIFINNNQSVRKLHNSNITENYEEKESFEEIEQMSYLNIVNSMEQYSIENLDNEFENIQVVKIDGNNSSRPYSFNILSKKIMFIVYKNRNVLNQLIKIRIKITKDYYINLYDEVIKRLYSGKNLFDLVALLITLEIKGQFKREDSIYKILKINNYVIGGGNMNYKDTEEFKNYGVKLRQLYDKKSSASKLSGITYRLLNALKIKDTSKFMDTLINSYMYVREEIPTKFVKSLNNQDLFQSIGYAFLIGLQGVVEKGEKDNEE
ncbi:type I-B CRISPR-associated protein Cas8b1/Cst1 [uncultured Clostridium sp.]|uniref:type I-B CRISPR-associated protein Cas8b1/Cst1 n=1 Tax=uncultured Clostridium sp. TaxID=59620 RepID=UPI0025EA503C|nr:type I-B CRISPR-associated protein Cas8b1/Cst1 [uncultured Clostridium sp.]